jgi:DNA-binding MarR family transcriptional regulator
MDAIVTDAADLHYLDSPPVLIAATSVAAMASAERAVHASGSRIADKLPIERAGERLAQQGRFGAVWVEIDSDPGDAIDDLLDVVSRAAGEQRCAAVISTTIDMLDAVAARASDPTIEILVNGTEAERVAAFAIAVAAFGVPQRFSDVTADKSAERLRQLSEEVSRIASTLARLSTGPSTPLRPAEAFPNADAPPISVEAVRSVIRARRLRARYFQEDLFADPAWDMLLDLLQAEIAQLRVPVSSLCIAAAVPATTALRWLKTMVGQGIFIRRADPHDGRRVFVELAPEASSAMRRYFADVGQVAVV